MDGPFSAKASSEALEKEAAAEKHKAQAMCLKFMGLTICLGLAFVKFLMRFNLKKDWQASDA